MSEMFSSTISQKSELDPNASKPTTFFSSVTSEKFDAYRLSLKLDARTGKDDATTTPKEEFPPSPSNYQSILVTHADHVRCHQKHMYNAHICKEVA
ncbi:hypothetical protein Tco_0055127 [Tanacetum coccineum]